MATTQAHMAARGDVHLSNRLIARAEQMGIDNASSWVQNRMGNLVTVVVEGNQTVTDVFDYAKTVRETHIQATPEEPGVNLGAVTDTHLATAIEAVLAAETAANNLT